MHKVFKVLRNKRGITLPALFLGIAVVVVFTVMVGQQIVKSNHESKEADIATNKAQIEQSQRSYLLARGKYATNSGKLLKDYPQLTAHHNFQKVLKENFNLTQGEIDSRIQVVNLSELRSDSYFNGEVKSPENYVIDTVTGKVYHIREKASIEDLKKLAEDLLKDSNDVIDLTIKDGDVFDLIVGGKSMTRVIASVRDGDKIILGGGNNGTSDIKLLLVDIAFSEEGNTRKLVDLTTKVAGGNLNKPVTAVRLINPGIVLAHYFYGGELKYELIQY